MFCFLLTGVSLIAANLIDNGNFESVSSKKDFPDLWKAVRQGGFNYSKDTNLKKGGKRCVLFAQKGKSTRLEARFLKLKAGNKYRLSADIKTENYTGGAGVYITAPRWTWSRAIIVPKGSRNWKRYSVVVSLPEKEEVFYRLILFAKSNINGKIWFDNISLEEIIQVKKQGNAFISAGRLSDAPVIDGQLDDKCWAGTLEASPFQKIGKYKYTALANEQTTVRIAYDNKNLYFGFICRQKCLESARNSLDDFRCDIKKHDAVMWKQDCVIMMLKTGKDDSFYEVIVNGAGTISDAVCKGPDYWTSGRKLGWDSNAQAAVKIADGVWTAEIAIPLKRLKLSPSAGRLFKACLGRLNISGNDRSTYFPMRKGFHAPQYFGVVKLGPEIPGIFDLNIGALGANKNTFSFKAASFKSSDLKLNITTMDTASRKTFKRKSFKLTPSVKDYFATYFCPDKNYSFMQFAFSGTKGELWNSPLYSKKSNSQKITIKIKERKILILP